MFVWHVVHAMVAWYPVRAKPACAKVWLKVADVQLVVEWHIEQSVGKPVCGWGLVAPLKSVWWQLMQVVDVRL